jgi:hypothetical protein
MMIFSTTEPRNGLPVLSHAIRRARLRLKEGLSVAALHCSE